MSTRYLYCIIRADEPRDFGQIGIGSGGNGVYTVHHRGLAGVVSHAPDRTWEPTRENVLAHERVNETVMREFTVVPMSFGTLFRSDEEIVTLLESTHQAFDDVLRKMHDKVEYGLKVLWDRQKVVARIEEENDEVRRLQEQIERSSRSTYFARAQLNRLIEAALEEASHGYVHEIRETLKPAAVACRSNLPIGDRMILNAAFLVDRAREKGFDDAVRELSGRHEGLLTLRYTGPWPPYNFVNIKLKLEKAPG